MKYYYETAIGADEVGTGEACTPQVYAATFVKKDDIKWLEDIGVKDSKKLNRDSIISIAEQLMDKIDYRWTILDNQTFNEMYKDIPNMNKIKAIYHNRVINSLKTSLKYDGRIILDGFVSESTYYGYLIDEKQITRDITCVNKGESEHLSVACASIIATYFEYKYLDYLSDLFKIKIPRGNTPTVIDTIKAVYKLYGFDAVNMIAKVNFKSVIEATSNPISFTKNFSKIKLDISKITPEILSLEGECFTNLDIKKN